MQRDQDGFKVPNDLVVLEIPTNTNLYPDELSAIEALDWFESRGENKAILVSEREFKPIFIVDADLVKLKEPESIGINLDEGVDTIYSTLKRYSEEKGFYHA